MNLSEEKVLAVRNLQVEFFTPRGIGPVVGGLSYTLSKGRVLAVVGESGSGKSETALDLIRSGHRIVADDVVEVSRVGDRLVGSIRKEFSFLFPKFTVDCKDWEVHGQIMEWDYEIRDAHGAVIASVTKEIFNWTDTYVIDVASISDALPALMVVLAIDAEKCSRD